MSEDDQDIGIEEDGLVSVQSGGNIDNKRALHNLMERKRRDSIKDSFRGLQECIPTLRGDKTSRAQVLKKTGDYISQMQNKIAKHQTEIEDLKKQNSQLEMQIRALEKTKSSFGSPGGGLLSRNNENIIAADLDLNAQDIIFENGDEVGVYDDSTIGTTTATLVTDTANNPLNQINLVGNGGRSVVKTISGVTLAPNSAAYSSNGVSLATKSLTVSGSTVTLAPATQTVTIQPGQSVLQNNIRIQRGMTVLRHEEFEKGCEAACNGPYDGKWSKTMIGYGPEDNHFVLELTYNYNISSYKLGNDFQGITIQSSEALARAKEASLPIQADDREQILEFGSNQAQLFLHKIDGSVDHATAAGRIAFAIPGGELKGVESKVKEAGHTILTPYITLDTPGKAQVQVVILADPDGQEICFVGDKGFRELSQVDPAADQLLEEAMDKDKSDEWFKKKGRRCTVMYDTKVDESSIKSKEDCLKKNFNSRKSFEELPFYVDPYVFKSSSRAHSPFIGLDLKYRYNMFQKLRFRFKNMNQNVCPDNNSLDDKSPCNPRCVEIDKSMSKPAYGLQQNMNIFSYDCEVGFYIQEEKYVISSRDEYRLSICSTYQGLNRCGEFSFQEFERRDKIVIHVPTTQNPDSFHVSVLLLNEDNKSTIFTQIVAVPHAAHNPMRIQLDYNIPSGRYQVAVIPLRGGNRTALPSYSAQLERPDYGQHALLIIIIILLTIIVVGIILAGYKRRQRIIEESCIEPNIQVKAGLLQSRSVFIITQLENSEHNQVVKELCSYLRTQCGIAETYFPLDEEGGVHSAGSGSGDPWKWAQKSYEKVKESGTVICIAGPDKAYANGSSLWPGIQDSQMFLVEPDLISLYREGRLMCISLPYSDVTTLPQSLPEHVVKDTKHIPRDMNSILQQILKVEGMGCSCVGRVCVEPEILPANLASRSAGVTLLDKINRLTAKIEKTGDDKPITAVKTPNCFIHRILKREVKRNRRRGGNPGVPGGANNLSKSSPAIISTETDKLLQDEKEEKLKRVEMVADLNGQTIQTTLKRYVEQKEGPGLHSTTGSGSLMTSPGGHTLLTSPGGQSRTASSMSAGGGQDDGSSEQQLQSGGAQMNPHQQGAASNLANDNSVVGGTAQSAAASSQSIQIELEQNLLSIKSLVNRDKTSVEEV